MALVGLMGAGKTTVGRRLAAALGVPFIDADAEIEAAAGRSITDIFDTFGEDYFRDGERRVIARLIDDAPRVIATGGGAFMDADTRALLKDRAISVWLRADIELLMNRVGKRGGRPLLRGDDPREVMERLMAERYPVYAEADITVDSLDGPHARAVDAIIDALNQRADETQ